VARTIDLLLGALPALLSALLDEETDCKVTRDEETDAFDDVDFPKVNDEETDTFNVKQSRIDPGDARAGAGGAGRGAGRRGVFLYNEQMVHVAPGAAGEVRASPSARRRANLRA